MYTVYAIASIEKKYVYVGLTTDLSNRLDRHNKGYEKTTKPYAPYQLIHTEISKDRESARRREKYYKGRSGKRMLYKIIKEEYRELGQYLT